MLEYRNSEEIFTGSDDPDQKSKTRSQYQVFLFPGESQAFPSSFMQKNDGHEIQLKPLNFLCPDLGLKKMSGNPPYHKSHTCAFPVSGPPSF